MERLSNVLRESCSDGTPAIGGPCQRHEIRVSVLPQHAPRYFVSVHPGEIDVEEDQIGPQASEELNCLVSLVRHGDAVAPVSEEYRESIRGILIVVHDQDGDRRNGARANHRFARCVRPFDCPVRHRMPPFTRPGPEYLQQPCPGRAIRTLLDNLT